MDTRNNFRSKSSIRITDKSIKKVEIKDIEKDLPKVQPYVRVYGYYPIIKKEKSAKDSKTLYKKNTVSSPSNVKTSSTDLKPSGSIKKLIKKDTNTESIRYEILKAKSDKLEIVRDLATYEYSMITALSVDKVSNKLTSLSSDIMNNFNTYQNYLKDFSSIYDQIASSQGYNEHDARPDGCFTETFEVKPCMHLSLLEEYKGVYDISGHKSLVYISSKLYTTHTIKCILGNRTMQTVAYKDLNAQVHKIGYKNTIEKWVLPYLHVNIKSDEYFLAFDQGCNPSFINLILKIKGNLELINFIIKDIGNDIKFEIYDTNIYLNVDKFELGLQEINELSIKSLKKLIQTNIFMHQNQLVWGKDPFIIKDNASKFLKNNFLSEAFDNYTRKVFSFKLGKLYKLEGYEYQKKRFIKLMTAKSSWTIQENSQEFKFIFSLQSLNFNKDHTTLSKSLELEHILNIILNT
jgi:hypothetical protein